MQALSAEWALQLRLAAGTLEPLGRTARSQALTTREILRDVQPVDQGFDTGRRPLLRDDLRRAISCRSAESEE